MPNLPFIMSSVTECTEFAILDDIMDLRSGDSFFKVLYCLLTGADQHEDLGVWSH